MNNPKKNYFHTANYGNVLMQMGRYPIGGATYIQLVGKDKYPGEPIATLTVNLPNNNKMLNKGEFFVKTWSENEMIANDALKSGLFVDTGRRVETGYVEAQIWKFAE